MILGLDHAALAVPDMQKALDFYCGVVGFEVNFDVQLPAGLMEKPFAIDQAGCRTVKIELGGTRIELFQFDESEAGDDARPVNRQGITHIALKSDDVQGDYERLSNAGMTFHTPPQGEGAEQWVYGRDPFGNVVELISASMFKE